MGQKVCVYYNYIKDSDSGVNGSTPGGDVYGYCYVGEKRFEHVSSSIHFLKQDMSYVIRNNREIDLIFIEKA